ncbi:MAG: phosphatidylserine decarboxylase [Campylobacterales bacterium]|nr:phosphatidylserine decarboxylase [Campylobacterales bacterium]
MNNHFTNLLSRAFGRFAAHSFAQPFQSWINRAYVRMMKLDMREFDDPSAYASLTALFTRVLNVPRSIDTAVDTFISPCDALVSACGTIEEGLAMQIKGRAYGIDALLGEHVPSEAKSALDGGDYLNLYLSPKDYHRYHAPCDLQVVQAIHIPGKLYPVNMPALRNIPSLFIENERVVLECLAEGKRLFLVMVGALNVGKMQITFEPSLQTNAKEAKACSYRYEALHLKKGEDFGCFEMGSTIVVLCEKGLVARTVAGGETVRFGRSIGRLAVQQGESGVELTL